MPTGLQRVSRQDFLAARCWGSEWIIGAPHLQAAPTQQAAAGWLKGQRKTFHLKKQQRTPWGLCQRLEEAPLLQPDPK